MWLGEEWGQGENIFKKLNYDRYSDLFSITEILTSFTIRTCFISLCFLNEFFMYA